MSNHRSAHQSLPPGEIAAALLSRRAAGHDIQNIPSVVSEERFPLDDQTAQQAVVTPGSPSTVVWSGARWDLFGAVVPRMVPPEVLFGAIQSILGREQLLAVQPERLTNVAPRPTYKGKLTGPVRSLLSIFDRWKISERDAALLLGCDSAEFIKDLRVGTAGLNTRDIQDRAKYLIEIYEGVRSLLHNPLEEHSWINAPLEALDGQSILRIMKRGSIADLLYVKSFIDHVNGR
jgi:hypothetical protein